MDYPKHIVSNQKEESISIQRVNRTVSTYALDDKEENKFKRARLISKSIFA